MGGRWGLTGLVLLLLVGVGAITQSLWWPASDTPQPIAAAPVAPEPTAAAVEAPPTEVAEPSVAQEPAEAPEATTAAVTGSPRAATATKTRLAVLRESMKSSSFRVRTRAVISLGKMKSPAARKLVEAALKDRHPGVRKTAEETLQGASSQASGPTPKPAKSSGGYYVHLGRPSAKGLALSPSVLAHAQRTLQQKVRGLGKVRLAPGSESSGAAKAAIARDGRTGYHLDISITTLEQTPTGGTRAKVSVVVQSYPGRNMRAIVGGAASVQGGATGDAAAQLAIGAAIQSATRKLPQAFGRFAGQ